MKPADTRYESFHRLEAGEFEPEVLELLQKKAANQPRSVRGLQEQAVANVKRLGKPHPKTEAFHFLNPKVLYPFIDSPALLQPQQPFPHKLPGAFGLTDGEGERLVFYNGFLVEALSRMEDGVEVLPLGAYLEKYGGMLSYLEFFHGRQNDVLGSLCQAAAESATVIVVPPEKKLKKPVTVLVHQEGAGEPTTHKSHIVVVAGSCSRATFNWHFTYRLQESGAPMLGLTDIDVLVQPQARLDWMSIQESSPGVLAFDKVNVHLEEESVFSGWQLLGGASPARHSLEADLTGEKAAFHWNSMAAATGVLQAHQHVRVCHEAPDCKSSQLFKHIAQDKTRLSVDGGVLVTENSQRTDARQLMRGLLVSPHARIETKPNLMIFADDVKCSHGATVGSLNPDQLFYLRTRGLSEQEALAMLRASFLEEVIESLPDQASHPPGDPQAKNSLRKLFREKALEFMGKML